MGQAAAEPPGYSAQSQPTRDLVEHEYQLEDTKGRAWLRLKVKSHSTSSKQQPLFFYKDTISGTVELDAGKADGAKAVLVSLVAGLTVVGQEEIRFLEIVHELWNAKTASSKPTAKQQFPFSITLPTETDVPEKGKGKQPTQIYPLPPSFSERASPAYMDYRLHVTVKRGALRVNQTLGTSFVYVPLTRAGAPSPLRQLAYSEGTPVIGPEADPEGWKVFPSVTLTGTIFDTRKVELECTFSYALGTPIPLSLTLRGTDEQALDLLASPAAIRVQLTRLLLVGSHATQDEVESGRSNNSFSERMGGAYFWPSTEGAPQPGIRVLNGELEVKKSLTLGFVFPRFSIRYMLALLPPKAPGFAPAAGQATGDEPLLVQPVAIASANAQGTPPPRSSCAAPPGYAHTGEGDYNTTIGFLENGNQRFLMHHGFQ
ncbi:uncharacterized protein BXZ73DRAFT_86648 [Epithele typhae]|uniref:uncharacterized protein n=1 Tax=Epithele typhae TaxID=378194 RepID=UPI002007FCDA|nr:uncharacterized protein BXZ73DRAFT_86648 [Epithele typhae]KAH9945077.1 hypothetical protein BXZ73DRAFT_86648 [Epithele typhae]